MKCPRATGVNQGFFAAKIATIALIRAIGYAALKIKKEEIFYDTHSI